MKWKEGNIEGVEIRPAKKNADRRGWLSEIFRSDDIRKDLLPEMAYVSVTHPGVSRGPHEHLAQTDIFFFPGPGSFKLFIWDNRPGSPTYGNKMSAAVGGETPTLVVIPPRIVHGYTNISDHDSMMINLPNHLYAGKKRKEPVDEVRYENDKNSPFRME